MVDDDVILEAKNRKIKSSIKVKKYVCLDHQWNMCSTDGIYNPPFTNE